MRRIVWGVLGLVALVLLLVVGALAWLTSSAGERWVLGKAVAVANEQLAGKLEAGAVELSTSGLTLRDAKLYTPEGELVAEVARVDVRINLAPLVLQHVELTSARLERPRLYLVQDERGLNLARALEPRKPKPEEPDTGRGKLRLTLKDLRLEDGYVDFTADTEEGPPRQVRLEDFDAAGLASYGAAKRTFNVKLDATGGLSRPVTGPLKLALRGQGEEENLSTDVDLSVAGLELQGRGGMRGLNEAWLELKRLSLAPETARAFVPSYPLLVPVSVEGNAQKQGDVARANLDVKAGSATMELDGSFNVATMRSEGVTLKARDINLAELMENGSPTSIVAELHASGGGKSLETLDGAVELNVSPSKFKGQPLGPVELRASARNGTYQLSRLRVLVPGASLDARGQGTVDRIQVKGSLSASDLSMLGQTVGRLGPGSSLPLSGSGGLDFQVEGPLRRPGVELSGSFASLTYEDNALRGLNLKAALPDVTKPLTLDATLLVDELQTGGRTFQNLSAAIATKDRVLEANVRTSGDAVLSLNLSGTVDDDQEGLAVSALTLAWPEATWTLQGSSHVGFGGGRVEVKPALTLVSDKQRLALTLLKEGERIDARLEADGLELTRLPKAFVPETLGLAGTVSARVAARGPLPRPDAEFSLTLEGGQLQEYKDIGATLKGTYVKDRATGTLTASVPAATVSADFDVPVQGLIRRRKDELSLKVNLTRLNIEQVRKMLGRPEPVSGDVSGVLELAGPAGEPRLTLTLRGEGIRYDKPPLAISKQAFAFTLTAASDETDHTLDARLEVQGLGREAHVALATPFTLGQLMVKPPTADDVTRAQLSVEGGVSELPLSLAGGLAGLENAQGAVSATFSLAGSLLMPQGKLDVQARRVSANGLPPLDGHLQLTGGPDDIRAELTALRYEGDTPAPLVELSAMFEAPLGAIQDREVIGWVPFELKGRLHPTQLKELLGLAQADPALREQGLQGLLSVEVAARGTPATPQVVLDAGLQQLGVGKLGGQKLGVGKLDEKKFNLGEAHVHYTYAEARSALGVTVTAPSGGTLLVRAGIPLDLSLPAVQQGLEVMDVPLDATLLARGFDMGFLSGAHEMVPSLGGVLEADAHLAGTAGAPTLKGDVKWMDGRLGLLGYGEYRDIKVDLAVTEQSILLRQLSARAGEGQLLLTANALRSKSGVYELTGKGDVQKFPIISDDQLVAVASLSTNLKGNLTLNNVDIELTLLPLPKDPIPYAHIDLPEIQRKDLQPLEESTDIVLVRNGVRMDKRHEIAKEDGTQPPASTGTGGGGATKRVKGAGNADEGREAQRTYRIVVRLPPKEEKAPQNFQIRGTDVNLVLGFGERGLEILYTNELALWGDVIVQRGQVSALGRRFDVQRDSRVNFTGEPMSPYLNITAEHINERENVTVFIHVSGQGKDFTIEPTSDPPMSETEIYTLLATGRRTLERNSGASMTGAQAASVVGSLVASQARKALSAELPLDVLSIEAGESGFAGTKLEVGKYITDKIYVGYTGRVGATDTNSSQSKENANAVRFEYQFTPQWSLEGNYGDARSGGLDLIWGKDY